MGFMFNPWNLFERLILKAFVTNKVEDRKATFSKYTTFKRSKLPAFNTEEIGNTEQIFAIFIKLNISALNFEFNNVKNISCVFYGCFKLVELDFSEFNFLIKSDIY